ncbi:hypothetical protein [Endozoicomonas sp. GU-1]|uniref:hypothetical protein n=1 Tax=Endozoicomonas sp. GU-1 TaxID=3009078 RepID=UPI0022B48F04|nr:hypothetical protein [Endozoicomonas sp. GU-1]WBA82095.1 hypothetical protein O2T12_02695 [Endozoicomonas sp. GU-1]WBA85039.1 hypothetical protein O3276_17435 [Endozoicomonas sp. GU-1]
MFDTGCLELYRADLVSSIVVIPRRFSNWKQVISEETMQSPSSSVTADTASPLTATETGRHRPANSRKQERKRSMSGYQVEQTTTVTGTLPPHQLQSESGPIPSIKRRRVTDNSRRIVCSATSLPANPEPMETKPAIPADAASRLPGVISFLSRNLPTLSDNRLLTGNEHTSAMVQVMPEPMKDVPLTTEINSGTSISEFSVSQQNELRTHLNNQEIQAILTNAGTLLKNLKDRKIQLARDRGKPSAHSLFSRLKNFSIVKDSQTFKGYFARANTFFLAVNPQQITNTSCLTSMLKLKTQIKKFAEESEENIQAVAANPCLKQIASMCNGKGMPDKAKVEAFVAWECWKVNGEFSLELLRAFSSMCNGKGLPDKAKVEAFVAWECWKVNGTFSLELLRAFSSMCHGKGLPDKAKVEAFVAWECWKVNDKFSLELLRAFSSMMSSRGLPDKAKVEAFVAWECWKVNDEFSLELLRAFSSMCNGKGLPDKAKVEALKAWECWKVNGEFSLELLRAFSSMCHGKGLPDKAKVEALKAWECWKVNGEFSLELLRAFSSMMSSRGLPDKAKVEALKAWECWKVNGAFSLELLRAFSSMMSSRGLPDKAKVKAIVAWECWKVNGEFSLKLLRAFSSMCNGKGLPDQAKVEAFMAWECWKVNGEFSLELLRAFSSMMRSRGLPDKAKVEALKVWECWKVNGEFSLELLRAFSSMCNGKGLPDKAKVEALKAWECWKVNGEFSLELLRVFSSLCNSKGLPDKAKVEALKAWGCWKVDGEFSLELLRAFSSMCHGKGLPDKAKVEALKAWECWKVNGEFSLELLRAFSSMMSSRGLPDEAKVEAFKAWECWKVNGEFSLELLRVFSSMCHGKGLPDKAKVEAFLAWQCWKVNGEFSLELLRAFSSMCNGKGLPDKAKVEAFVQWLPSDENKNILKLSCRIFASFGLPSGEKLTENEKTLRQCLNQYGCTTEHGDDNSDEDLLESSQMKALALFFSGPAKWRMKIAEFQQYLAAHKSPRNGRVAVRAALKSLLPILAIHGGTGIQFWIEKYRENPRCKGVLTKALAIPAPLALTKFALTQLPESEMQEYLELCRNLKPAPTQEQWYALKPLCQQLGQRFDFTQSKRTMLEILWQQSEDNRSKYADKMDELFKTFPTISQWHELHRVLGPHKMQQVMDACLEYQAKPEAAPDVATQQQLLEGMLLTNHYLPEHIDIPDLCFSNRVSTDDERGVVVDGDHVMLGHERLWHFITAILFELKQTEYQFRNQKLTVMPTDGEPVVLQKPDFTLTDTGLVIKNWTLEQLTAFFKATEFTEQWYEKPQDKREPYAIRLEAKLAQMKARTKETRKAEPKKAAFLLSPSMIINIIKYKKPLKPAVWSSLEHYASNGQLTTSLCKALSPVIRNDNDGVVPELVKNAVAEKLVQIEATKTPVVTAIALQQPPASTTPPWDQDSTRSIQGPKFTFEAAMEELDRFPILGNRELELLEPYRKEMILPQLMSVLQKINHYDVDKQTQNAWHSALECRKKDPLGLNEIDIDIWESDSDLLSLDFDLFATEAERVDNNDWMEEFLQG